MIEQYVKNTHAETHTQYELEILEVKCILFPWLTLALQELIMEACSAVTFGSVDEILWCDYLNETSSAVLLHGTIGFSIFYKRKFGMFLNFGS